MKRKHKKKTPKRVSSKAKREALHLKRSKASKLGWKRRKYTAEIRAHLKRSKASKLGWKRRKYTAEIRAQLKRSKSLKLYHRTGLTKKERREKAEHPSVVLIEAPRGEEIPAFQVKDQVESDPGMSDKLDSGLSMVSRGDTVFAHFSVSVFAADGTKQPDKAVQVPVVVSDPDDREQFWRDFYHEVREDLEDELYGEDGSGGSVAVTLSSVAG